jgi:cyclopropane fatty-acyl-phospholipid synthase-like methyltransferase
MATQRLFYRLKYRFGHPRWDSGITPPELVEIVEGPDAMPPGRALDLGCGTGTNALCLARHRWDATGVDFVPGAIARANQKSHATNVQAKFVVGDVTRLEELGITGPFTLVVDIGCFHGIAEDRRSAYAKGVSNLTKPGSTLLMFAFGETGKAMGARGSIGVSKQDLISLFGPAFELVDVRQGEEHHQGEHRLPAWYRLVRR